MSYVSAMVNFSQGEVGSFWVTALELKGYLCVCRHCVHMLTQAG